MSLLNKYYNYRARKLIGYIARYEYYIKKYKEWAKKDKKELKKIMQKMEE